MAGLKVNDKTKLEVQVALRWARHFPHREEDVLPALLEVREIYRDHGYITVDLVKAKAQEEGSILGRIVYADTVEEAAEKHYTKVAGDLVRAFEIEIVQLEKPAQRRKYFHLVSAPKGAEVKQAYQPVGKVLGKENWREEVVQRALNDLRAWEARYGRIQELTNATDAVRGTIRKLQAHIRKLEK
jgi:hypothetical protein